MTTLITQVKKYAIHLAFLQAWSAVVGSLYFSEIRHFAPCILCWWQRIFMYPIAVILAVALVRKDKQVFYYVLPLSTVGAVVALYQYLLQMTPLKNVAELSCSSLNPCSQTQILYLGFITIPFLSLIAFLTITALMVFLKLKK